MTLSPFKPGGQVETERRWAVKIADLSSLAALILKHGEIVIGLTRNVLPEQFAIEIYDDYRE